MGIAIKAPEPKKADESIKKSIVVQHTSNCTKLMSYSQKLKQSCKSKDDL
jgi:hypothetical protein